jgi:hypothetical protein
MKKRFSKEQIIELNDPKRAVRGELWLLVCTLRGRIIVGYANTPTESRADFEKGSR